MLDLKELVDIRIRIFHCCVPDVFAVLDQGRRVVEIALRIEIEVRDVVSEVTQISFAVAVAGGVRWSRAHQQHSVSACTQESEMSVRVTDLMYVGKYPSRSDRAISK